MCSAKSVLKLKTINSWQDNNLKKSELGRKSVKICIIDNDGVNLTQLKQQSYEQVTWETDYTKLDDFKDYDVILCDIKGIGLKFGKKKEGLSVAEEIKKAYPYKVVLIYSGQNPKDFDPTFNINDNPFDGFVVKGESTLDLVSELDTYCEAFWNPVKGWKRIESILRKDDVSNKVIAYLEHEYVYSISHKRDLDIFKIEKSEIYKYVKNILEFAAAVISIYNSISG